MGTMAKPVKPQLARQARAAVAIDTFNMRFDPTTVRAEFPDLPVTDVPHALTRLLEEQANEG
jgi:hypothetical protein